jgi:hypothetical protein
MNCLVAFFAWLMAAGWIYTLITMLVEGDIDLIEFILGVGITFWLGYTAINPFYHPSAPYVSFAALGAVTLFMPIIRGYHHRKAHASIDAEQVERACLAIEFDPKNWGAEIDLARMCYKYKWLQPAVIHLERAVQMAPLYTYAESRTLKDWKRELARVKSPHTLVCMACGTRNTPERIRCHECGRLLLALLIGGKWVPEGMAGKILRIWLIVVALAIAGPWLAVALPSAIAMPVVITLFLLGTLMIGLVVRK